MKVYHGSNVTVDKPDLLHSKEHVDFGRGFYVTTIYAQAEKWSRRFKRRGDEGIVSTYEFDEAAYEVLKILKFDAYSETWLEFVLNCRREWDSTDYDLVIGGVANDKVFNTVELFFDGLIDKKEALRRLQYEKPNMQMALRTEKALSYLKFERSKKI